jgi:hypothetical protein
MVVIPTGLSIWNRAKTRLALSQHVGANTEAHIEPHLPIKSIKSLLYQLSETIGKWDTFILQDLGHSTLIVAILGEK